MKVDDMVYLAASVEETENVAASLAEKLVSEGQTNAFLALYGDLGAGKTAFVRGLCRVLAPGASVCSPTYAIVNEYEGENALRVLHFDMYRIESEEDLLSIGFYDYEDAIFAVEWSEHIPYALPNDYWKITILKQPAVGDAFDSGAREIRVERITKG